MHPRYHDNGFPRQIAMLTLAAALLLLAPEVCRGSAAGEVRRGNKAYGQAKYEQALEAYRRAQLEEPDLAPLHLNIGNVHYRQENWSEALREFELAQSSGDSALSARATYNMGNTLFRQQDLPAAAEAYKSSIELDPTDMDARYNLELVLKMLEQQQQQQQQQQQDQSQQEQSQQEQQEESSQEEQDQQQEQKQDQDQAKKEQEQQSQEQQQGQQQEQQEQEDQPREEKESPPPQPGEMSPQEAARLLNAIREQEEQAQEEQRAARVREGRRGEFDW